METLELNSLVRQVPAFVATFSTGGLAANRHLLESAKTSSSKTKASASSSGSDPDQAAANDPATSPESSASLPDLQPELITSPAQLTGLVERLMACRDPLAPVAVDTETSDLNPFKAQLVGVGVCWGSDLKDLAYIPVGHTAPAAPDGDDPAGQRR